MVGVAVTGFPTCAVRVVSVLFFFFFQAEDGIRDLTDWSSDVCSSDLEMGMKANLLPTMKLSEVAPTETAANTGGDSSTTANVRNWMECVRSRGKTNANIDAGYSHSEIGRASCRERV